MGQRVKINEDVAHEKRNINSDWYYDVLEDYGTSVKIRTDDGREEIIEKVYVTETSFDTRNVIRG